MSATTQEKRITRVERRLSPEVLAALHAGRISHRMADDLLYLSPSRQRSELQKRLRAMEERDRLTALIAGEIRVYLDSCAGKVDLLELNSRLKAVVHPDGKKVNLIELERRNACGAEVRRAKPLVRYPDPLEASNALGGGAAELSGRSTGGLRGER